MRCSRVLLVVAAAILCVAASGSAHAGPGPAEAFGTTIPVGHADVRTNGSELMTSHRSLRAPPGDSASASTPDRSTKGRLQ